MISRPARYKPASPKEGSYLHGSPDRNSNERLADFSRSKLASRSDSPKASSSNSPQPAAEMSFFYQRRHAAGQDPSHVFPLPRLLQPRPPPRRLRTRMSAKFRLRTMSKPPLTSSSNPEPAVSALGPVRHNPRRRPELHLSDGHSSPRPIFSPAARPDPYGAHMIGLRFERK